MATKRDYYEILEVSRTATADEIKRSYRKLAVKFHPDKNPGDPTAEEKFNELGEAYDILMDENKRAASCFYFLLNWKNARKHCSPFRAKDARRHFQKGFQRKPRRPR